jgi:hypothetical protein
LFELFKVSGCQVALVIWGQVVLVIYGQLGSSCFSYLRSVEVKMF